MSSTSLNEDSDSEQKSHYSCDWRYWQMCWEFAEGGKWMGYISSGGFEGIAREERER